MICCVVLVISCGSSVCCCVRVRSSCWIWCSLRFSWCSSFARVSEVVKFWGGGVLGGAFIGFCLFSIRIVIENVFGC